MTSLGEIKQYSNKVFNIVRYTSLINKNRKNIPIYDLVRRMDTNHDKILTSEEIYQGLLDSCSDKLEYADKLCGAKNGIDKFCTTVENYFTPIKEVFTPKYKSITGELEARPSENTNSPESTETNTEGTETKPIVLSEADKNLQALGIDIVNIKRDINKFAGENGIDISDMNETVSEFAGQDVDEILAEARKYGLNIDLETLSISDIENLTNRAKRALGVVEDYESVKNDFNNGNIWSGITSVPGLISDAYSLYKSEPIVKQAVDKAWVEARDNFYYQVDRAWVRKRDQVVDAVDNAWVSTRDAVADAALATWRFFF